METHLNLLHASNDTVVRKMTETYWILKQFQTVKRTIGKECLQCRRMRAKPFVLPVMNKYPKIRIERSALFTHIGSRPRRSFVDKIQRQQGETMDNAIYIYGDKSDPFGDSKGYIC